MATYVTFMTLFVMIAMTGADVPRANTLLPLAQNTVSKQRPMRRLQEVTSGPNQIAVTKAKQTADMLLEAASKKVKEAETTAINKATARVETTIAKANMLAADAQQAFMTAIEYAYQAQTTAHNLADKAAVTGSTVKDVIAAKQAQRSADDAVGKLKAALKKYVTVMGTTGFKVETTINKAEAVVGTKVAAAQHAADKLVAKANKILAQADALLC